MKSGDMIEITPYVILLYLVLIIGFIGVPLLTLFLVKKIFRMPLGIIRFFLFSLIACPISLGLSIMIVSFPAEYALQRTQFPENTIFTLSFVVASILSFGIFAFLSKIAFRFIRISQKNSFIAVIPLMVSVVLLAAFFPDAINRWNMMVFIVDKMGGQYEDLGHNYTKNNLVVKFGGNILKTAFPSSFVVFQNNYDVGIAKDSQHVYSGGTVMSNIDSASYHVVEGQPEREVAYMADKNAVYYFSTILSRDPENFRIIRSEYKIFKLPDGRYAELYFSYAMDSKRTYFNGVPMHPEIDLRSFEPLSRNIAKDSKNVYLKADVVGRHCGCDLPSLEVVSADNGILRDKNNLFLFVFDSVKSGEVQLFEEGFKKDGIFHYYDATPVEERLYGEDIDPSSGQKEFTNTAYLTEVSSE